MNPFRRCVKRKLLSLILFVLVVQAFVGFVDVADVVGQPSITLKWTASAGTGSTWLGPLAADLDNDGFMEIVMTGKDGTAALDSEGNVIWSVPYGGDHVPCEIVDLDKDGIPEVVMSPQYINGSSGGVLALHGNNGSVYWYNPNAAGKGTFVAVADVNGDGYPEIFAARGGKITAQTYDGQIFASTYTYYPCYGGLTVGDTDFDGVFEVYLGERSDSYPSYPSGGRGLRAFWADNLTEIWAHTDILCSSQAPVLADVDKDGDLEIIILHQRGGVAVINTDGSVNTYNGIYRKQLSISGLSAHSNGPVADVDGDGNLEIITNGDASHTYYPPKVFDLVTWEIEATLPFESMEPPGVGDVDGDGKLEIIAPNHDNVTIFKFNSATKNYDVLSTIPIVLAHEFSILQDVDADGKLELVFDQHNSWVSVYDVETSAPAPLPRSGLTFYSQYRTRVPEFVVSPDQPPKISEVSPVDGAVDVSVSLSELSFKLTDYQGDLMTYTVVTSPDVGSGSGINVANGVVTVPVSGLTSSTTYTWTVTATAGADTTTRSFTFYTEGDVVLNVSTVGTGSVIRDPDSATYAYGTPVQLTAVADDVVYEFSHWEGDLELMGSNNPATILMDGDKTVTAVFTKIEYRLRIDVSPEGRGTITCNNTGPYYYGDVVQLTVEPSTGWSFSHWESDLTGSQNPATITMDSNKRVTAVFTPQDQYNLTITVIGNGTVNKDPDYTVYAYGEIVTLTAVPDLGWKFVEWSGNISSSENPASIVMDSNKTVYVTFIQEQYVLTIDIEGLGKVAKTPDQSTYTYGTQVQLTASANIGWSFSHWSGSITSSDNPLTFIITGNMTITARFVEQKYVINASVSGTGGIIQPLGPVVATYGQNQTFIITPDVGYHISDVIVDKISIGPVPSYTFYAVDNNHTITALFALDVSPAEKSFTVTVGETDYVITTVSNSTVSGLIFNETLKQLSFNVTGASGTTGFCNITVPAELMSGDFSLYLDDLALVEGVNYTESFNGTHYVFSVTYANSSHVIDFFSTAVVPDFAGWLFLPFLISATLLGFALRKRLKKQPTQKTKPHNNNCTC